MTEYELIRKCLKEDVKCQRMLFEQYAGKMMTVCLRYAKDQMEAEDLLQEGFIKVFRFIHQFKFEGSFEGWIRRIMVNNALKNIQKKKIQFSEINDTSEPSALPPYVYASLGEVELMRLIHALPEGYRMIFNLNVIEGFSHEEIAVLLNIQPSTSRSQLVKARKMLQDQILQLQKIAV